MMWNPFRFKNDLQLKQIIQIALETKDKNLHLHAKKELKRRNNKFKK